MNNKQMVRWFLSLAILLCGHAVAWSQTAETKTQTLVGEDVVLRWNRVLMETVRTPGQHPATIMPVRSYAIMHAAIFDAMNSIEGTYTPYLIDVPGSKNASIEAAAAKAARDVLVGLYPTREGIFDAEFIASLEGIDPFRTQQGIRVGQFVAERILAARANDGWSVTPPSYSLPATPGNWQPTPPANSAATFTHYPAVTPFAIQSPTQFAPAAPPVITDAEYALALNEVKEVGSATSATRTADQTQAARLWANVNTPTNFLFVWNNVARTVAETRSISTAEKARLFALTNIALHDALQTAFASKFEHGLWRPVTAIRRADEDGNAATEADPAWSSLIATPPYPSYAGNMATIGTSQSTVLALFFGRDDIRFSHTWEGAGGATRSYVGFGAMANEQERARVWGGIHFTFDNVAGQSIGRNVGSYVFQKSDAAPRLYPVIHNVSKRRNKMKIIKIKQTARIALALGVIAIGHAMASFAVAQQAPALPAGCEQLAAPAGFEVAYRVYAVGVQVYRWNGTTWAFVGPEAGLFANVNYRGLVGSHYAGPTWETVSGSLVISSASTAIPCTPDPTAIPWLRLTAVSSNGPGVLDGVKYIQRVNTVGGLRPTEPGTTVGQDARIPYTTEYYFYKEVN